MQEDPSGLASVRSRTLLYGSYIIWAISAALVLFVLNAYISAVHTWLGAVERVRGLLGFTLAPHTPDWWLIGAGLIALAAPVGAGLALYTLYRRAWRRRLNRLWGPVGGGVFERIRILPATADDTHAGRCCEYLNGLLGADRWSSTGILLAGRSAECYRTASERVMAEIERDIAQRAWSLGLVVGMSRKSWIDSLAIAAAALELQLHVLTSLGKRPSVAMWMHVWRRAASSLFINWYLNGEQSLTFRLMIRKIGLGLQASAQIVEQAADALAHWDAAPDDVDWDDVEHMLPEHILGLPVRAVSRAASVSAGALISVGAFGMQQIGRFIEQCGEDLFQGALAATILYGHGIDLAADCLALDRRHRESSLFSPRIDQVMTRMCGQAGLVLRAQVRSLRGMLRERRRLMVRMAKDKSGSMAASVKTAVAGAARSVLGREPEK